MKNVAVLTEDGAFALFFCPHPGGFDSSRVPIPGNLPSEAKKNANAQGQPSCTACSHQFQFSFALILKGKGRILCQSSTTCWLSVRIHLIKLIIVHVSD